MNEFKPTRRETATVRALAKSVVWRCSTIYECTHKKNYAIQLMRQANVSRSAEAFALAKRIQERSQ